MHPQKQKLEGGMRGIFIVCALVAAVGIVIICCPNGSYSTRGEPRQVTAYESALAKATYECIQAMVEDSTGLPHDRFDASLFDIVPQFSVIRRMPHINKDTLSPSTLGVWRSTSDECRHTGYYGLKIEYRMPESTSWGSYNVDSDSFFDVSEANFLEFWVKGALGDERFEFVLWDDNVWPGRPSSAETTATNCWKLVRIPLEDFEDTVDLASLWRLSIGFNNTMSTGGTIYFDEIAFVDSIGNRIHVALNEQTSVTNIGLYIVSVLAAWELDIISRSEAVGKLDTTLTSIESLKKWHGFPQTWNHVVSLDSSKIDTCICTIDLGNLAAGLIILRQALYDTFWNRASAILDNMEWDWLYDDSEGLPYGCRYPNGNASGWHCDWLCADSRLAHFIGIGTGKIPANSWDELKRDREDPRCKYHDLWHFEPGWDGGGLFMAFLPAIFLDEEQSELGESACNFVKDQFCYAEQIEAPAWGWSATSLPPYGEHYYGYGDKYDSVLVPHASILAVDCVPWHLLYENLGNLEALGAAQPVTDGRCTFDFGFRASVYWDREQPEVCTAYLVLDQSMAFLSLFNHTTNGRIRELFCQDSITLQAIDSIPDYVNSCLPPDAVNETMGLPRVHFRLCQNSPNPFTSQTEIRYSLPEGNKMRITIYDLAGRKVSTLVEGHREAGRYSIKWDGTDSFGREVGSGIYFCRLQADDLTAGKKMILLR